MKLRNIIATNSNDFLKILKNIDISVPSRTKGRKTEHTEIWSIVRYLAVVLDFKKLNFPLCVIHQDKPDFRLEYDNTTFGIECTESIPSQFAWAISLMEEHFPDGFIEPDFFRWGSKKYLKVEIMEILTKSQSRLHGNAWFGKSVEKEWAIWMFDCINSKLGKLNNQDFKKYNNNYLLIYDNLPQAANDISLSTKFLGELLKEYWKEENNVIFNKIYIESKDFMIEFSGNEHEKYSIPNLQKKS